MNQPEKKVYGTTWLESELLPIGSGPWVYVVGIIEDNQSHERKVRIAKGPLKSPNDKIPSQVQRLNIKEFPEWEKLTPLVKKFCNKLKPPTSQDTTPL